MKTVETVKTVKIVKTVETVKNEWSLVGGCWAGGTWGIPGRWSRVWYRNGEFVPAHVCPNLWHVPRQE